MICVVQSDVWITCVQHVCKTSVCSLLLLVNISDHNVSSPDGQLAKQNFSWTNKHFDLSVKTQLVNLQSSRRYWGTRNTFNVIKQESQWCPQLRKWNWLFSKPSPIQVKLLQANWSAHKLRQYSLDYIKLFELQLVRKAKSYNELLWGVINS